MRAALRIEPNVSGPALQSPARRIADQVTLYGVFGLLGFAPVAFGAVQPWAIYVLESGSVALLVAWLLSHSSADALKISASPLFAPMAAFAVLVVLQVLLGRTSYRYQTIHDGTLYCAYGLLCFLVVQCLWKISQVYFLAKVISAYGLGMALFAIFQSITSNGKLYWFVTPRSGGWIYGPYVNHNHYAGLMEMLIPFPLVASLTYFPQKRHRVLALGAASVMAGTIFLSGSRGGMIAFCVQMIVLGLFLLKRRKGRSASFGLVAFLVALAGLLFWLGGNELRERVVSIRTEATSEISGGTRLAILHDGLRMWTVRPILGWGLGTFPEVYPQYRSFYTNLFVNEAHNDYLELLVETGILGFVTMLWFLARMFSSAAGTMANWHSNMNGAITVAAILGCTGILVHSFVDFNLQIPGNAALFYVLCTLAAMEPRFSLAHQRGGNFRPWESTGLSA